MVNWWPARVMPLTLLLFVTARLWETAYAGSESGRSHPERRSSRSVEAVDDKRTKDLNQKALMLTGNKTKIASVNNTYAVEETPTQSLRNTGSGESPPHSPVEEGVNEEQPKELPIALIIASPVVAVFIIVFVCVAYYCHSAQLDARAREMALRMKADAEMAQVMVQTPRPVIVPQDNTDMEAEHTSLRSVKTQTSSEPKRGAVIEDREVIKYSRTRRHSTFII